MKFGKTYVTHQIPEWSIYYMNYKHLKKIIKSIDSVKNTADIDESRHPEIISDTLSSFFYELDRDIEKVDSFYNTKYKEYNRRWVKIVLVLGYLDEDDGEEIAHNLEDFEEVDEIINILIELRSLFRNLKWFGELNHRGFVKILKKLDKKLTSILNESSSDDGSTAVDYSNHNKEDYLGSRIEALPFANGLEPTHALDVIHNILTQLGQSHDVTLKKQSSATSTSPTIDSVDGSLTLILKNDDVEALKKQVDFKSATNKALISILNKATLFHSFKCVDYVWSNLDLLYDDSDFNGRNFFHQHVISLGKSQLIKEEQKLSVAGESPSNWLLGAASNGETTTKDNGNTTGLLYILNNLKHKRLIFSEDHYHRTPLHYAAQYGLVDVTKYLIEYGIKWGLVNTSISIDDISIWGDQEGLTPLHLSIIKKHPKTTKVLLSFNKSQTLTCPDLLLLAVRLNSRQILNSLITEGHIDVNYTDLEHRNESALYIAARLNYVELVEFLLEELDADTEICENVFGWSPIFIAAAEGYMSIVKILKNFGANYDIVDDSGWLPIEHACLRGHLEVADLLVPKNEKLLSYDMYHPENNTPRLPSNGVASGTVSPTLMSVTESTSSVDKLPESHKNAVNQFYKTLKNNSSNNVSSGSISPKRKNRYKPVKSFGHRYLNEDESLILLTLGTTDLRDNSPPIELNKISLAKSFATELDTALSLSITCISKITNEQIEPPVVVDLPLEDFHGSATDPISFKLSNNMTVKDVIITFDIIPTYQVNKKVIGRAIALLQNAYTKVGNNLRSLHNNITLPIMESNNLDILGSIRFEYLQVLPFKHDSMSIARSDTYWKQLVSTRVIGHRGLGQNKNDKRSLQLGENTVESFIAAASLGASYVEFDVQLTKDYVPVVYHDFTVAESGVDIPMHSLTLEQFMGLNKTIQRPNTTVDDEVLVRNKPRAKSHFNLSRGGGSNNKENHQHLKDFDSIDKEIENATQERMKLTKTWKSKGYKGNARGSSVASNFVTFKELFGKVPSNVGFNIEVKYPMLDEAQDEDMGEIAIDLNFYVDTILKVIYDENTTGRDIVFSSFHPDVCLLLSLKQPTMPVLFLTEAGTMPMYDIRASSLQNAVRFAKKWNLLGIVSNSLALVKTPRLAQVVKSMGLVCVTYGVENNQPELAKLQMQAGVDAVIVDSVLAVREGLREHNDVLNKFEDSE
ncbi:Glycerophosphodiester phosphodiesterase GDE1 [Candida viswanathii]|uniref:Glycerophosphodiester phosphodiesterase GDE1 n=1 Tax=Candida viswanathii TaxID=5486 RepID=A0A367YH24_9ASCO|nr:Glycerophosphodiester phosphodiesterase GDE1 [Candida viswanathii]